MKEEKFEPAKVVGKVDLKKESKKKGTGSEPEAMEGLEKIALEDEEIVDTESNGSDLPLAVAVESPNTDTELESEDTGGEKADGDGATDSTTRPDSSVVEYAKNLPDSLKEIAFEGEGDSLRETIEPHVNHDEADAGGEGVLFAPEAPKLPTTRPTFRQKVAHILGIVVGAIVGALDDIGLHLLDWEFGGNFENALKKDPYKDTSLTELARHKDIPFTRQRLAECLRAAAVGREMEAMGEKYDSVDFYKRVELSRVRNQEVRLKLARRVLDEHLTVKMVRDEVRKLSGRKTSADSRLGKAVIRQLGEMARLSVDDETTEFLLDKDRLKAALNEGERGDLLKHCRKFGETINVCRDLLTQLEKTVVESFKEAEPQPAIEEISSEEEPEPPMANEMDVTSSSP